MVACFLLFRRTPAANTVPRENIKFVDGHPLLFCPAISRCQHCAESKNEIRRNLTVGRWLSASIRSSEISLSSPYQETVDCFRHFWRAPAVSSVLAVSIEFAKWPSVSTFSSDIPASALDSRELSNWEMDIRFHLFQRASQCHLYTDSE